MLWSQLGGMLACSEPTDPNKKPPNGKDPITYPRALIPKGATKEDIKKKITAEPFSLIYKKLEARSKAEIRPAKPGTWESKVNEHNAGNAEAAAFLAWLNDDKAAADRALANIETFKDNWGDNTTWDINIRMPAPLMQYTGAYDLLKGTKFFPEDKAKKLKANLISVAHQFFKDFVLKDSKRGLVLTPAQNNHPIRTACAIGFVGMYFPDAPESKPMLDWALSELDYLWGENGHYVMADGGVTEGPFYFNFAIAPSISFFLVADKILDPKKTYNRNCLNRSNVDPWKGHGCKTDESFQWKNPLKTKYFQATVDWSLALRLPYGQRAPIADSYLRNQNGSILLIPHGAPEYHYWDWATNPTEPYKQSGGMDLGVQYLIHAKKPAKVAPPTWTNRFFPTTGHAVFRSGWSEDDRFFVLLAEQGSSRKTLHDHVDGTAFTMAAYGELLLTDSGYYKTGDLKTPETAHANSHNVILINGYGAPKKGLLNNWGDKDAFLENTKDGKHIAWAEARQDYEETEIVRGVAFVRKRYFVIADRLETKSKSEREHRFRLHAFAGFDVTDGKATLEKNGIHVSRPKGGVYTYTHSTAGAPKLIEPPHNKGKAPHVHSLRKKGASHFVGDAAVKGLAPNFLTVLAPYKAGEKASSFHGPLTVEHVDCGQDATGWLIKTTEGTDFAWIRGPKASNEVKLPDGSKAKTDAAFVLFSLDGKGSMLSRGKKLEWNGKTLIDKDASKGVEIVES